VAFDFLVTKLRIFGPFSVNAVKTGINLALRSHFAMVFVKKTASNSIFCSTGKLKLRG
jgi:hypothetical protein